MTQRYLVTFEPTPEGHNARYAQFGLDYLATSPDDARAQALETLRGLYLPEAYMVTDVEVFSGEEV